jgi:predicted permease
VSPGFRADHTLTGQIALPWNTYDTDAARLTFAERLIEAVGHQPGVVSAGAVTNVPLSGHRIKSAVTVKGFVVRPGDSVRGHYTYGVAGDYFAALGIPLLEGRFLSTADSHRAGRTCVIDEDFARRYFAGGGAIGRQIIQGSRGGGDADACTIVGVVGAVKQAELTDDQAQGAVYFPYRDRGGDDLFVVARTSRAPESLTATVRTLVRDLDAELPVENIRSMDVRIADSLVTRRSPAVLTAIFAAVALLLAAIGTYGVLSYAVQQRRREIGVRMALGAGPDQIRRQFLSLGLRLLAAGTTLGLIGAWMSGRAMHTILFDVPPVHVATLAGAAGLMSAITLVACLLPSQSAARISPMEAMGE